MFDAAAAATASEVASEQVAQEQADAAVSSDGSADQTSTEQTESQELLQAIVSYSPGESTTEVAFIDPTVPDYESLVAGMGSNVEIIMLDATRDGMEQIAESLADRSGIDAIHLITHGAEGRLNIGTGALTHDSMTGQYADELATIQQALSEQADILVYGCDFAAGQAGQEAATLLSQLTGADVAASTDATGFAGLGGDWVLETQIGTVETQVAVDYGVQANWVGLLAGELPPTITNLSGDSLRYSEGAGAVVIEQSGNALVADVDSANFDAGRLTVSIPAGNDSAEDVLTIRNQGTGAGQIGVSGSNVTYGGVTIGTFAGGSSGTNLVVTLNASATPTVVTALVRNITYQDTDTNAPTTGARTVRYVLTDGDGGTSANYDTTVTVSGVNDAPTDLALSASTVAENAATGTVVGTVTGTDVDAGDTKTYSLTNTAGGRFAINASTGVLTVANGSLLNYESARSHSVTVRVTDRGGLTYDEAFTISLTNVNQTPAWLVGGSLSLQKATIPTEDRLLQSDGSRPLSVEIVESKTAAHPAYSQEEIGNGILQDGTRSDVSKEPPPFSPAQIIALTRFLDEMAYSEGPSPIGEILDRHIDEVKQLLQNMEDEGPPDSEVSRGQLDQIPTVLSAWLIANGINLVPTRKPLVRARQPEGGGPQRY